MNFVRITDNCLVPIRMDSFICSTILHRWGFSRLVIRATRFAISGAPKKKKFALDFVIATGLVAQSAPEPRALCAGPCNQFSQPILAYLRTAVLSKNWAFILFLRWFSGNGNVGKSMEGVYGCGSAPLKFSHARVDGCFAEELLWVLSKCI